MVLSEFYILQRTGVVPMSIAGIAKEVSTITISAWFFGDQLTPLNITGVGITVAGIALFTYHKYRKSIESTVPLDAHGNPISEGDDTLEDTDAEERVHLTAHQIDEPDEPSPERKCEACKAAKIPCRFKDRERYFAERSRAIAGPSANAQPYPSDHSNGVDAFSVASSSSSPSLSNSGLRSNSHSPKASGLVSPEGDANGRYPYPADPRRDSEYSRNNSYGYPNYVGSPAPVLHHPHNSRLPPHQPDYRHVQLTDPERSQFPHPSLMPHFIQLFFENLGHEYGFLTYDQLMNDYYEGRLPPALANCVAALASRFSNIPELTIRGLHNVAESYLDSAKGLVNPVLHLPSMDTLHAIMLLAWAEYKNGKHPSFRSYAHNAVQMAQDLGLSDSEPIMQIPDAERRRRQITWANILQLHSLLTSTHPPTFAFFGYWHIITSTVPPPY
ncbi:hypothetical protein H1R20_g5842, partial [Candolleomyces eurysporus]